MGNTLMVLLGCDCDPDRPRYGGARYDGHRTPQGWRGISEGIAALQECLERVRNASSLAPRVVFCLRSDTQMGEIYGDVAWPISEFMDTWRHLEDKGHEMALHPHLWRWDERNECWFQETQDGEWIENCLEVGFEGFCRTLGKSPTTSHMGWTYHNNTSMKKLSEMGLKVDFSASPGVYCKGGPGDGGSGFDNEIDWLDTPVRWYQPSERDYRRPSGEGESALSIMEIPKFTTELRMLRAAKQLAFGGRGSGKTGRAAFYQITLTPFLYGRIINERLDSADAEPFFATYFHPDELISNRPRSARAALYSADNLERNILQIIEGARKRGRDVAFVTGDEAFQHIQRQAETD